jgi:hypothetical protein
VIRRVISALVLVAVLSGVADAANLVGWWRLDETSGTTLVDSTGNGRDMTLSGTYTLGSGAAPVRFSDPASTLFASGWGLASTSLTGIPAVNAAVSISLWFNATSNTTSEVFSINSAAPGSYRIQITNGAININSAGFQLVHAVVSNSTGTWYHVAATYDGTTDKLYFQGSLIASATQGHDPGTPTQVVIGAWKPSTERFAGAIDDVRVYDAALTAVQISALAAGGPEDHTQWFGGP